MDLRLDKNEGPPPCEALMAQWATLGGDALQRYATPDRLEAEIARSLGLDPEQVLVTCGGDDALERFAQVYLGCDRPLAHTTPTFGVLLQRAAEADTQLLGQPWLGGPFPLEDFAETAQSAAALYVVGPNNPTGASVRPSDWSALLEVADKRPLLADLAYVEFDDNDPSRQLVEGGALVLRTFSKAFGLAGLRVGYLLGPADRLAPLRKRRAVYAVAGPSLALARLAFMQADPDREAYLAQVREERPQLVSHLRTLGLNAPDSSANFAYGSGPEAERWCDLLGERGIRARRFRRDEGAGEPGLRITTPGNPSDFSRLVRALDSLAAAS